MKPWLGDPRRNDGAGREAQRFLTGGGAGRCKTVVQHRLTAVAVCAQARKGWASASDWAVRERKSLLLGRCHGVTRSAAWQRRPASTRKRRPGPRPGSGKWPSSSIPSVIWGVGAVQSPGEQGSQRAPTEPRSRVRIEVTGSAAPSTRPSIPTSEQARRASWKKLYSGSNTLRLWTRLGVR